MHVNFDNYLLKMENPDYARSSGWEHGIPGIAAFGTDRSKVGRPLEIELRLSVQDSPNSTGVVIDAIRCTKLGLERGLGGPLEAPSASFLKSLPRQARDDVARRDLERFIGDGAGGASAPRSGSAEETDLPERAP